MEKWTHCGPRCWKETKILEEIYGRGRVIINLLWPSRNICLNSFNRGLLSEWIMMLPGAMSNQMKNLSTKCRIPPWVCSYGSMQVPDHLFPHLQSLPWLSLLFIVHHDCNWTFSNCWSRGPIESITLQEYKLLLLLMIIIQNLMVKSYCWKHWIHEAKDMEKSS